MKIEYSVALEQNCIEDVILPNDPDGYYNPYEEIRDGLPFIGRNLWDFPTPPEFEHHIRLYEFKNFVSEEG